MNIENFKKVLAQIEAHPETWNQYHCHCGTTHCFAGHAQNLAGKFEDKYETWVDARRYLGIENYEAEYLFNENRTLQDFKDFLAKKERVAS